VYLLKQGLKRLNSWSIKAYRRMGIMLLPIEFDLVYKFKFNGRKKVDFLFLFI